MGQFSVCLQIHPPLVPGPFLEGTFFLGHNISKLSVWTTNYMHNYCQSQHPLSGENPGLLSCR